MAKPHRRSRFSASNEGRYRIHNPLRLPGAAPDDAPPPPGTAEDAAPVDPATAADLDDPAGAADQNDELSPAFQLKHMRRARNENRRVYSPAKVFLTACLCLALGATGGYYLGRANPSASGAVEGNAVQEIVPLTAAEQAGLDAAFAARHEGKYAEAEEIFAKLAAGRKNWAPMQVEIARTRLYAHDARGVAEALQNDLDRGKASAEAHLLLAARFNGLQALPEAEREFARAVALDPTQPNYYFLWAECLRSQGKLLEATAKLRSALLCNQYETATGLYRLKLWLCAIEAGSQDGSQANAQIDAALAQPLPPMEALFAGAARNLKAGDADTATKQILLARSRTDPVLFPIILNDPVFASIRLRPELATLAQRPSPPAPTPTPEPTDLPAASPATP